MSVEIKKFSINTFLLMQASPLSPSTVQRHLEQDPATMYYHGICNAVQKVQDQAQS